MPKDNTIPIDQTQGLVSPLDSPTQSNRHSGTDPPFTCVVSGTSANSNLRYRDKCFAIRQNLSANIALFLDSDAHDYDSDQVEVLRDKVSALKSCGSQYMTLGCHECKDDEVANVPYRCKSRVCPECSSLRLRQWVDRYTEWVGKVPSGKLRHITLTLANCDDLAAGLSRIQKYFKALRLTWFKDEFEGGLVGYEQHLGKSGGRWNIHCHVIYEGSFIPQAQLSLAWNKITGDSKIVDIRTIGKKGFFCKRRQRAVTPQESALRYVLKYVTKGVGVGHVPNLDTELPVAWSLKEWQDNTRISTHMKSRHSADWDIPALVDMLLLTHNRRLVTAFGDWYGRSETVKHESLCPHCGGHQVYLFDANAGVIRWEISEEWQIADRALFDYRKRREKHVPYNDLPIVRDLA